MIKLTCKQCGGKLELTDDIDRFACGFCGTEWIVQRGGGIVSLKGVEDSIKQIETSSKAIESSSRETEKHTAIVASEIRIKRLQNRIKELENNKNRFLPISPPLKAMTPNKYGWLREVLVCFWCISSLTIATTISNSNNIPILPQIGIFVFFGITIGVIVACWILRDKFDVEATNKNMEEYEEAKRRRNNAIECLSKEIEELNRQLRAEKDKL